jgi:hypothetical protein
MAATGTPYGSTSRLAASDSLVRMMAATMQSNEDFISGQDLQKLRDVTWFVVICQDN